MLKATAFTIIIKLLSDEFCRQIIELPVLDLHSGQGYFYFVLETTINQLVKILIKTKQEEKL